MQQFPSFQICVYAHEYFLKQCLTTKQLKKNHLNSSCPRHEHQQEWHGSQTQLKKLPSQFVLPMTWAWAGLTETEQFNCNISVVLLHTPGHIVANTRAWWVMNPCCIQGNSPIKECYQQESVHIAVLTMTSYLLTLCYNKNLNLHTVTRASCAPTFQQQIK